MTACPLLRLAVMLCYRCYASCVVLPAKVLQSLPPPWSPGSPLLTTNLAFEHVSRNACIQGMQEGQLSGSDGSFKEVPCGMVEACERWPCTGQAVGAAHRARSSTQYENFKNFIDGRMLLLQTHSTCRTCLWACQTQQRLVSDQRCLTSSSPSLKRCPTLPPKRYAL